MPTSRPYHLSWLCEQVLDLKPKSILDVGFGFGSKGMLFREYTDVWNGTWTWGRETQIDGIEIFETYITDLQRLIYNNIYCGDALVLIDKLRKYDLIYIGDVIEHFSREDGINLLEKMKIHGKTVIVATPVVVSEQGAVYGNEHETHVSQWTREDFKDCDVKIFGNTMVAVYTTN